MYKGVIRWHVRCPQHTRYTPEKGGQGAIRGACPNCLKLYEIQRAALTIRRLSGEIEEAVKAEEGKVA